MRLDRDWILSLLASLFVCGTAFASGPRWVTGPPYFTGPQGVPIGWQQTQLLYSTDPGNLSANVNHEAADALVAAAAGVWNVPVANISIAQGGQLAEHVSGANIYVDSAGLHLPADVMSINAAAIPLAVIYDTDGSVTDTLLGTGASDPTSCRQNAVTESVDSFAPAGYILHALIVVNGRCTGTAAAAQSQLRYQLMRAFGRALGLAWSQTNDNVFTGTPTPTSVQAQNWPILHPIDILCGTYTYQCLPNPFQLRTDDIAGLVSVYPLPGGALPVGKVANPWSQGLQGRILFPTGQGMAGVNVLVQRMAELTTVPDAFYVGSGVSGAYFSQNAVSPFVAAATSPAASFGTADQGREGFYQIGYFPMISQPWENLVVSSEPINPLYTGEFSVGPYGAGTVAPAGSAELYTARVTTPGMPQVNDTVADAPAQCGAGGDGSLVAPMQLPATGWWPGLLCGYGHASYVSTNVKAGRSFTLEVTALDAAGLATTAKAMPVIAWFGAGDSVSTQPSLGLTAEAFNSLALGTTALAGATGQATSVRLGIADQRGDGRPDFNFQARLFYADRIAPAQVAASGGTVTISGMGFRSGNAVYINGVAATVASWTANTVVLTVPSLAAAGATSGTAVDVQVVDRSTGSTSTMTGVLTYLSSATLPNAMRLLSAPSGMLLVSDIAAAPLTVQLLAADGVTPVVNEAVTFSAASGTVLFGACNAAACTVRTNALGVASTAVTPGAAGSITVQAVDGLMMQQASFTALAQAGKMVVLGAPESPVRDGTTANNWFTVQVFAADGVTPMGNRSLTFSVLQGQASFDACAASVCTITTPPWAIGETPVTPLSVGTIVLQAADGDVKTTVTLVGTTNADTMQITSPLPATMSVGGGALLGIRLLQPDGVTGDRDRVVTFTAPAGVTFADTGTNICSLTTDGGGSAANSIYPTQVGTIVVKVAYGSLVQTQTVAVQSAPAVTLKLISAPADGSATGKVAGTAFAVQLQSDGKPLALNGYVVLTGPGGGVVLSACGFASCEVWVDGNGVASTLVTPLVADEIALSAAYGAASQSVQFLAAGQAETMSIVNQPGSAGAPIGTMQTLAVKVIGPDGIDPLAWDAVTFSVLSGPFTVLGQSSAQATSYTDGSGVASVNGIAVGTGPVQVRATDGVASQVMSFYAGAPANVMQVLSAPAGTVQQGSFASVPFAVQLFASDGVTPVAGKNVTFTVTNGLALFGACASGICVVSSDAHGMASTTVQPTSAGKVGLLAAYGVVSQAASFVSAVPPDVLRLVSAPASGGYVGMVAASPFAVQVFGPDGTTPAAGRSVTLSVTSASAAFAGCNGAGSCVLVTDSNGLITTAVSPLGAGSIGLQAMDGAAILTASFTAIVRPDLLHITSLPAANSYVDVAAAAPLTVLVTGGDGATPASGKSVTISVTNGSASLGACAGTASCILVSDASGTITSSVTPLAAGTITLLAAEGTVSTSASFTAVDRPDTMLLLSAPTGGVGDGVVAAQAFAVQVLAGDGVTPRSGRSIVFSATGGGVLFNACGAATCTLQSDAKGIASTTVTPTSVGTIVLQAATGSLLQSAIFQGVLLPDVLQVLTGPASGSSTGIPASAPFALRVLLADGVTPAAGKKVTLAVTNGSASFAACGVAPACGLTTDAAGLISTLVTPLSVGAITLSAADGSTVQEYMFSAVARPDVLTLVAAPAGTLPVGVAAGAFTVKLMQGDGVTPDAGKAIVFSFGAGSGLYSPCGAAGCTVTTAADGTASAVATPGAAGLITLNASFGALVQSASFTAFLRPEGLTLISGPASGSFTGMAAAIPFSVLLLQGDGVTPDAGGRVTLAVIKGLASFAACPLVASCVLQADASGIVSSPVIPNAAGPITLSASVGSVVQTYSFTAVARPDTLALVTGPPGTLPVGVAAPAFTVRLVKGDGVTPDSDQPIIFSVSAGHATWSACGGATYTVMTGSDGTATALATPSAAGAVTLTASAAGGLSQAVSFIAVDRPDVLRVVSAPASGTFTGVVAATPFSVLVLQGDQVTPAAGRSIQLAVSAGSASLAACGGLASCVITTDSTGAVSSAVTPNAAGTITLSAADGPLVQTATFTAVARPDGLRLVSVPIGTVHVGTIATTAFSVQLLQGDGITPDAGKSVLLSAVGATLQTATCNAATCTQVTGADGSVSVTVTPTIEGTMQLTATFSTSTVSASFWASANQYLANALTPPIYVAEGAVISTSLSMQTTENGTPASGQVVLWKGSTGLSPLGSSSLTDASGTSNAPATVGPSSGGTPSKATACVWTSVCASFSAVGVPATSFQPAITSGGLQTVLAGASLQPVTIKVTDGAGHAVAAAPVTVYQTVRALDAACPSTGRCPAASILISRTIAATAGNDGQLTVQPLTVDGLATQTEVAVATGTQGFVSTVLTRQP